MAGEWARRKRNADCPSRTRRADVSLITRKALPSKRMRSADSLSLAATGCARSQNFPGGPIRCVPSEDDRLAGRSCTESSIWRSFPGGPIRCVPSEDVLTVVEHELASNPATTRLRIPLMIVRVGFISIAVGVGVGSATTSPAGELETPVPSFADITNLEVGSYGCSA